MKNLWNEIRWFVLVFVVALAFGVGHYFYMKSQGYHMEWSSKNFRMIWVDEEGKP